jgi:ribosomal protein L7/L12
MSQQLSPERYDEVRSLLARGQKIGAIKVYREATGLGLAESKDAVEAIERAGDLEPVSDRPALTHEVDEQLLRDLLAAGKKIEAIKVYRDTTGLGLAECKAAVEALERGTSPPQRPDRPTHSVSSGCFGMLAAVGLGGLWVLGRWLVA